MDQDHTFQILFSDSALLVVNKPAGISTLPDGYDSSLPSVRSILDKQAGRVWFVHRLDKETSGVLLLARTAEAHRSLNHQFEQRQVVKDYHALAKGNPEWEERTINLPLRPNGDRNHRTVIDQLNGKPALTHIKVLEHYRGYSLLEAVPETGRTHQIRAHLNSTGLYIIGDKLYGERKAVLSAGEEPEPASSIDLSKVPMVGMGLHARFLQITHPTTGERVKFEAPYPLWWQDIINLLRAESRCG